MVHVPAVRAVMVAPFVPLTVQTPVVKEVNVTGLPEAPPVALAAVVPPTLTVAGVNVIAPMVWLASVAVVVSRTSVAAVYAPPPVWL